MKFYFWIFFLSGITSRKYGKSKLLSKSLNEIIDAIVEATESWESDEVDDIFADSSEEVEVGSESLDSWDSSEIDSFFDSDNIDALFEDSSEVEVGSESSEIYDDWLDSDSSETAVGSDAWDSSHLYDDWLESDSSEFAVGSDSYDGYKGSSEDEYFGDLFDDSEESPLGHTSLSSELFWDSQDSDEVAVGTWPCPGVGIPPAVPVHRADSGNFEADPCAVQAAQSAPNTYDGAPAWKEDGSSCGGSFLPGTATLKQYVCHEFPGVSSIGGYSCRQNTKDRTKTSVHGTGRAIDIMIPKLGGQADNGIGDVIANNLLINAKKLGVQYIIWDRWQWSKSRGPRYYGPNGHPHDDHLHVELHLKAANEEIEFYKENNKDSIGPCQPRKCTDSGTVGLCLDKNVCAGQGGTSKPYNKGAGAIGCQSLPNDIMCCIGGTAQDVDTGPPQTLPEQGEDEDAPSVPAVPDGPPCSFQGTSGTCIESTACSSKGGVSQAYNKGKGAMGCQSLPSNIMCCLGGAATCNQDASSCHPTNEPCCAGLTCNTQIGPMKEGFGICVSSSAPASIPAASSSSDSAQCPWMEPTTRNFIMQCGNGECNYKTDGWSCCNSKGMRLKCPKDSPVMCKQTNDCGGNKDRCCEASAAKCAGHGGVRTCADT